MIELGIMLGLLAVIVVVLVVKLLRRNRTENVDGLLIEQARRVRAYNDRVSYSTNAVYNHLPNMTDLYRPWGLLRGPSRAPGGRESSGRAPSSAGNGPGAGTNTLNR